MAVGKNSKESIQVNFEDINWIKDSLENLGSKIDIIDKTTTKLKTIIVGDADYGFVGIIVKVKEHAEYIEDDKKLKAKLLGASIVLGSFWGIGWGLLIKFWDKLF